VLPDRYPLAHDIEAYIVDEHGLGRMLDYGVIAPRIEQLYEWSARVLGAPGLRELICDGVPAYGRPGLRREVWVPARTPLPVRLLSMATAAR